MLGGRTIEKSALLLDSPLTTTVTMAFTVPGAKLGAVTTMLVLPQLVTAAAVPPNHTMFDPCVAPKFVPVMVTDVPLIPEEGLRLEIVGAGVWTRLIIAVADFVGSAFELAVKLTVGGLGRADGAV